jgi:hypothetical protein
MEAVESTAGEPDPRTTTLAGPAAYTKEKPILSSERAPNKNKTLTVKE